MTWNETDTSTCNRVFAGIHSVNRFALFLPFNVKIMLVKTLGLLHFNYCDVNIDDMTVELSERLQRAQNYCIRFIFNLRRFDHVTPYFEYLGVMKLKYFREYHIVTLMYVIISLNLKSYLSERYSFLSQISSLHTRIGALLLSIPQHSTTIFNQFFLATLSHL